MNDTTSLPLSAEDEARIDALLREASMRLHTELEIEVPSTLPWNVAKRPQIRQQERDKRGQLARRAYKPLAVAASLMLVVGGIGSQMVGTRVKSTFSNISNTLPSGDEFISSPLVTTPENQISDTPADIKSTSPVLTPSVTRDVIYTATMRAETTDIDATANQLRIDTLAANGTVFADTRNERTASLTLKVPPQQFDDLLRVVATRAKVTDRSMQASDVTAEGVDLQARLTAAKTSRDRVAALLTEATNLQNIVSLEGELRSREMEVEQISGQLRVLQSQVGMGTISVELIEPEVEVATPAATPVRSRPTTPGSALKGGWRVATTAVQWVLIAGAATLPFTPLGLVAWGAGVVVRRRRITTHNNPAKR
jgi:hypothetical protein